MITVFFLTHPADGPDYNVVHILDYIYWSGYNVVHIIDSNWAGIQCS